MSVKKVAIGSKPSNKSSPSPNPDSWVENRTEAGEMKRLTFDIPASLHRQIKAQCAMRGTKIADELRELLLEKYGKS